MRKLLIFFIAITLCGVAYVRTDGFSKAKIAKVLPNSESEEASRIALEALSQPYSYLGKGRQCFVFASEDGRYVLKFFNESYHMMPWYSFLFYEQELNKRSRRRAFFESSYEIAFKEFGEEILHLHMGLSSDLPIKQIRGPGRNLFRIDLNRFAFVLQKRGEPFYAELETIYGKEGIEGLKREIDVFTAQIRERIAKRIADADVDIENNWGYAEGRIFHLDPGRLYRDSSLGSPARQKEEWHIAVGRFLKWLKEKRYDEAVEYLENIMLASSQG